MLTSPDNVWTPDSGDDYALTEDLAAMADSIQLALTKKANYGLGTTAEMNAALGDFNNGALWYNTTTSSEWRKVSGAWVDQAKRDIQNGVAQVGTVAASGGSAEVNVTFSPAFSAPPKISITPENPRLNVAYSNLTASGMTIRAFNWTGIGIASSYIQWIATRTL